MWYGWPDYTGGLPITNPRFKPKGKPQPSFLLAQHPMQPPRPVVTFTHIRRLLDSDSIMTLNLVLLMKFLLRQWQ